ncbi:hypothetical protein L3V82_10085 [Thiotrichales bacterium 19S3-7]|nr:hypothetical protein [Thiotrichales bacterium 19S3-7]MCF6802504.1 hypothetical protein [Thiotrichales bacterium 19S3-11]
MIKRYLRQPINISYHENLTKLSNQLTEKSPANLKQYYRSGRYDKEIKFITDKAMDYTSEIISTKTHYRLQSHKLAAIFDIDETMLSNANILADNNFVNSPEVWAYSNGISSLPAITAVKHLYDFLLACDVSIFIITARELSSLEITKTNLAHCGYHTYEKLFLKPNTTELSFSDYKAAIRKDIIGQGYQIILNIGDKLSDFQGGYYDQGFLLPNYFY